MCLAELTATILRRPPTSPPHANTHQALPHLALQSQVRWFHQSSPWYLLSRLSMLKPACSSARAAPLSAGYKAGRGMHMRRDA